ncbi:ergothioneine biosynthesis protein EgtB [Herbaspirillum lusitanum]|uniref:Ergothioneine biosynthesis protein EgtB n=1 Tax=Herbaspirillum lusitanum TaxID=213312 RepID=A0ABW9A5V9_9BURK
MHSEDETSEAIVIDQAVDAAMQEIRLRNRLQMSERFRRVRRQSLVIAEPLSAEDCCVQSMPDASPVKWHLAHTSWFFETFILERFEPNFHAWHPAYRVLFNSYYEGVGEKFPRPQRGLLTRPALDEVLAYRKDIDQRMLRLIEASKGWRDGEMDVGGFDTLLELGLQHEQQHQELMLTDIKHLLSINPLKPAYQAPTPALRDSAALATPLEWRSFEAGIVQVGHDEDGFCFDNELPLHRQFVEAFACASRLVSNLEYLQFIEAGGYDDPALWLSEGWEWRRQLNLYQPLYWQQDEAGNWLEFTEYGLLPLESHRAALHLSYYEADAYARWAGARLLTEAEWEHAACEPRVEGIEFFGVAWQWTSSSYAPYPGFSAPQGAVGEYNGKFMVNQYVLRGSSIATPLNHARLSYRNFFPAAARWQFSGIRLAKSL